MTSIEPIAYRWTESKFDCWRYDEMPNPHRECEPLYAGIQGDKELVLVGYRDKRGKFWKIKEAQFELMDGNELELVPVFSVREKA